MAPHFHFHPTLTELEAPARVAYGEVVHPAAQYRVDTLNYPLHRLGSMSPEDLSKRLQQRRALLQLWRVLRSPSPRQVADATEVKPQEPKACASGEIDCSALLFVVLLLGGALVIPGAVARGIKRQLGAVHDGLCRSQYWGAWGARRDEDVGDRFVDQLAVQRPSGVGRKLQR